MKDPFCSLRKYTQGSNLFLVYLCRFINRSNCLTKYFDTLGQGVIGYVDSDYAGNLNKRWSTTGYVFTFARRPINWKSTL